MITLAHGSGGKRTHELIEHVFYKYFANEILLQKNDSSLLEVVGRKMAVTTDSFVVKPLFFPGGDIGKLALCGTINDLAVSGAKPMYVTVGFIIEEGFQINTLEQIVMSMAHTAEEAHVKIIAGDTKVVEKGCGDQLFIQTTGIGYIEKNNNIEGNSIKEGDCILINGTLADHGICLLNTRQDLGFNTALKSDCSPLHHLIKNILRTSKKVKFMRDPTRGGLATTLNEIAEISHLSIELYENKIPIREEVNGMCDILGLDPLYIANEGKVLVIVDPEDAAKVLERMREHPLGVHSALVGKVIKDGKSLVYLKTEIGGTRVLPMEEGPLLPRIC